VGSTTLVAGSTTLVARSTTLLSGSTTLVTTWTFDAGRTASRMF
jgi:X-X-X-Leu-X-X-Gly heptad repeat protein